MSDDNIYYIEKILDRRRANNRLEYKIKWEGYPLNQCTWEPIENLQTAIELVEDYDKDHPLTEIQKPQKKFLGRKKMYTKKQKKAILEVLNQKNEGGQEKEKNEKIENTEEVKQNSNNKPKEDPSRKYNIDDSLKSVTTVRKKDNKLVAVVEKMNENGEILKEEIETSKLKTDNPWILLDFYESKIKFT